MSNYTKEELIKLRDEWKAIRKAETEIDYSRYRNDKIKRRWVMLKRADDITYRKRNTRRNAIWNVFKDDINKAIMEYAKRPKYLDENGKLIFLD